MTTLGKNTLLMLGSWTKTVLYEDPDILYEMDGLTYEGGLTLSYGQDIEVIGSGHNSLVEV